MNSPHQLQAVQAHAVYRRLIERIGQSVLGSEATLRLLLAAFFTRGHVLLEDYPGTGKTTLAKALAAAIGVRFQRLQCTPDLLPADILGVSIFDPRGNRFELHKGPIFSEILLADEINRASPRTQSALLEAMAERQISLDGTTYRLADGFFVIATQNPVEFHGTYPLPEAQLDRFAMCLSLGYLSEDIEVTLVTGEAERPALSTLEPCVDPADIACVERALAAITISPELARYAVRLVAATRTAPSVALGASPRASLTLVACARALALFDGGTFVCPEHLQELAGPVLAHRLLLDSGAYAGNDDREALVARLLRDTPVPR